MMLMARGAAKRRLRAPARHGEATVDPPLDQAGRLLSANVALFSSFEYDCQGRPLGQLAGEARHDLLAAARRYTSTYRDVDAGEQALSARRPIVLTGHQPQLFHAGVWFKNFALSELGRQLDATAVNLLIDNDPLRTSAIRVPTGSVSQPRLESVPFDDAGDDLPFEERRIRNPELFASFGRRVEETIAPLVQQPLIRQLWPLAAQAASRTANLGQCLAQARHELEARCGLHTLEVPFSSVCAGQPFQWFVAHLVAHLPRFWDVYNSSLLEFRRENCIRSRSHPVPELAASDDWLEAPLWVWTSGDPQRRRLLVRSRGEQIELSDGRQMSESLSLSPDGDAQRAVAQLASLADRGIKLRPRALITTMYARLILGDLFLHGIGGAKYDQLTDIIIRRFFGLRPPEFITLTATALLPVARSDVGEQDLRQVDRQLREWQFHPETFIDGRLAPDSPAAKLTEEKRRWVAQEPPRGERRERHLQIARLNQSLQQLVEPARQRLFGQRARLVEELRRQRLLGAREFSFCLFPQETLCSLLLELCATKP